MERSSQRSRGVAAARATTGAGNPVSRVRRDIAVAIVLVALLLAGIAAGAIRALRQAESGAVEPAGEYADIPAQYVNQGVVVREQIPAF